MNLSESGLLTFVFSLNPRASRNFSRVSHQAVVLGATFWKRPLANSSILRSTARVGRKGAQGNRPSDKSCKAGSLQVQSTIFLISIANNINRIQDKNSSTHVQNICRTPPKNCGLHNLHKVSDYELSSNPSVNWFLATEKCMAQASVE